MDERQGMQITITRRGPADTFKYTWMVRETNKYGMDAVDSGKANSIWWAKHEARRAIRRTLRARAKGRRKGEVVYEEWV